MLDQDNDYLISLSIFMTCLLSSVRISKGAVICEALLGLQVKNLFLGWKNSAEVIILLLLVFIFKLNAVNLLLAK